MKLDIQQIHNDWKADCKIDDFDLEQSSRTTPILHARYLEMYSLAKLQLQQLEAKQMILLKRKWLYYNGKMDQDQIEKAGWEFDPFNGLKVLKGEMNYYYDADLDIQLSESKIQYMKVVLETLKEIIDTLKWRHQTIKNIIEYRKFQSGA